MRITKLSVRDFRRYREFEVPLAPGLTIVHGPNEAGKTTIQRALELVLTRKATAGGQEMDGFRSWDAPDDARPVIAIDFEIDDDDNGGGTRPGSIEKSFRGQRGTVRLEVDGQVITDPTLADQALAELTGIPTEAFFRSTASIRHHELADLDRDEAPLRDRLQASISGADRGTSRAKKRLERAIFELKTQGAEEPGPAEGRGGDGRSGAGLRRPGRDGPGPARARSRHAGGSEGAAGVVGGGPRRAAGDAREGPAGRAPDGRARRRPGAVRALPDRGHRVGGARRPPREPSLAEPAARPRAGRRAAADARHADPRAARRRSPARSRSRSRSRRRRRWRPICADRRSLLVALGLLVAAAAFAAEPLTTIELGTAPHAPRRRRSPGSASSSRSSRWWLRRDDRVNTELRDVEIDRRLRGRSEMEAELKQCRGRHRPAAPRRRPAGPRRRRGDARRRAGARRPDRAAPGPARRPRRQGAGRDAAGAARHGGARGRAEDATRSRPSGRSPASRAPGSGWRSRSATSSRRSSGPATTRRTPAPGSTRTPSTPRPVAGHAERLATWRDELAALQRRTRVYERTLREIEAAEQATMKTATRYLEETMVARHRPGHRRSLPPRPGRRQDVRHPGPRPGARRLGRRHVAQPGHARPRLSRRPDRARPARHRRPPPAADPRRPVRDVRRRAGDAVAGAAARRRPRLPGDLPDDVGPVRRLGRRRRPARGPDRARRRRRLTERDRGRQSRRRLGWGSCPRSDAAGANLAVVVLGSRRRRSRSAPATSAAAGRAGGRRSSACRSSSTSSGSLLMAVAAIAHRASRCRRPSRRRWRSSAASSA